MSGQLCLNCNELSVTTDPTTNSLVCHSCGLIHNSDHFHDHSFAAGNPPAGNLLSPGDFTRRDRLLHRARAAIADITSRLHLTPAHAAAVSRLVSTATDGNLGSGDWFPSLVAACAVIVMRQHRSPLSLTEAAGAIGRDPFDLGRMVGRVSRHLEIGQLPELDSVCVLERAVRELSVFDGVEGDKREEILGQGRFVYHCAVRWFLTTGRHPLPVVAAVLAFVCRVNGLEVAVEEIAGMVFAGVATSRQRLRELMEVLVRVARKLLPWGNDVTVKNIVYNAPVLIRFMELKSKARMNCGGGGGDGGCVVDSDVNLDEILNAYSVYVGVVPENGGDRRLNWDGGGESLKLLAERICVSNAYDSVLDRHGVLKIGSEGKIGKRRSGLEIEDWIESWKGRWKSEKGLTFDQVLGRSEGFEALPPSFIRGMDMRRIRRLKMEAAKCRIRRTMKKAPCSGEDDRISDCPPSRKRRKRDGGGIDGLDWEDCIIELLLLHNAEEEEIELGYYNRLLDLHVFGSPDV